MKQMTLMQHFSEMRRRILWVFAVFAAALLGGWYAAPALQAFLTAPLMDVWGGHMLYTGLSDGMMIRFSLATLGATVVTIPVLLWQVWAFVSPGLKPGERRAIWPILVMSPVLFLCGAGFAFYILFPFVFRFFIELNQTTAVPTVLMPAVRDYLRFAIGLMKVFGVAFQLPLILVLMNRVGVLKRRTVQRMRRYAIVGIVIVAAVLTPPDVVSQICLAVPMWLLFEGSILFMRRD